MIKLAEPYKPRPIRYLELWHDSGWQIKVYGISYNQPLPRPALVEAAKSAARLCLPQPAVSETDGHYGVGFMGVHDGRGVNFVFVDWWADENELHHHVHISPANRPDSLAENPPDGSIACVWDLRVLAYERQAWLDTVLANPRGPDLVGYLTCLLNEDV